MSATDEHRFYQLTLAERVAAPALPAGMQAVWWRPGERWSPDPRIPQNVNRVWSLFHHLRLFSSREFGVIMLCRGETLLHRAGVFPRFFRFPFMGVGDLQVGDTWTAPEARGQGLAGLALQQVLHDTFRPGRRYWYLVEEANAPSIRVIEKAGFRCVGSGARQPRAGVSALGFYAIARPAPASPSLPTSSVR